MGESARFDNDRAAAALALSRSELFRLLAICAALTLLAAAARFTRLGALGFYGDEDLTALVAHSVATGQGPHMPSGMEYRRALPYTWITAASARLFGDARELSYRIPSALFGTLTVPLLFLLGRWLIGTKAALLAALLLALSGPHLLFARQARMYAAFLFFYVAAAFAVLAWARYGRASHLLLAALAALIAASMHLIGVFILVVALIPLLFPHWSRAKTLALIAFATVLALATRWYEQEFVGVTYAGWVLPSNEAAAAVDASGRPQFTEMLLGWRAALVLVGGALAIWLAARTRPEPRAQGAVVWRSIALFASALAAGAFAGAGQLYGFALATAAFLLIHPWPRAELGKHAYVPGALLLLVTVAGVLGAIDDSLLAVISFPYPYAALLAREYPVVFLLFGSTVTWLCLSQPKAADAGLRIAALCALLPLTALGLSDRDPAIRFALGVYPFLLLLAGAALLAAAELPQRWITTWHPKLSFALAVLLVLSGVLGAHGLPQTIRMVTLEHGQPIGLPSAFAFRPDFADPGRFLRRSLGPNDAVIAEDVTQLHWYAGRVDYWFRGWEDARVYLYNAPDGHRRDQYVSAAIAADPVVIDSVIARSRGRVWFVTSGESSSMREYYLSPRQRTWLEALEQKTPATFTGRDQKTRVYCLNCNR